MVYRFGTPFTVLALVLAAATALQAQPRRATLRDEVSFADGVAVPAVTVTLTADDGAQLATAVTDAAGRFEIRDVAPGRYQVVAASGAFEGMRLTVGTAPVVDVPLRLRLPTDAPVEVVGDLDAFGRAQSSASGEVLRDLPARLQTRALPQALAAMPGWAEEDNGLLHVRGVDDGVLYVEDGIPVYDRFDVTFGIPPALADIGTIAVTTGHTPAAFGLKAGAVVEVFTPPASAQWRGQVQVGGGSSDLGGSTVSGGGPSASRVDVFGAVAAERSSRFLDPVHPGNLHNTGGVAGGSLRATASTTPTSRLSMNVRLGRSRFEVPHGDVQEAAEQDQRQRITQSSQSLAWQQYAGTTSLHLAGYHSRSMRVCVARPTTLRSQPPRSAATSASDCSGRSRAWWVVTG